jgi:HAD superfamily hydrolase (TIGR01549 family)
VSPRVVFFDWGRTLTYRTPDVGSQENIWVRVAHELGVAELTVEEVRARTNPIDGIWQQKLYESLGRSDEFWREYNAATMDALGIQDRREEVSRRVNAMTMDPATQPLFPEVREVLSALQARGLRLGLISNGSERLLETLHYFDLDRVLDPIVFSQEVRAEKPDSRVFEFALRRAECVAPEAVHVGDSFEADYLGSTRAGLRGIWLNRGGATAPAECEQITDLRALLTTL